MKTCLSIILLFICSSVMSQSLRDSLYGGKLKANVGQTTVSKDTGKVYVQRNEVISAQKVDGKTPGIVAGVAPGNANETMPDSLNKLFYAKQKSWKRYIEINVPIITQYADDSKKVKKGTYNLELSYEIGLNGRVTITEITCEPHNDFLIQTATTQFARPPVLAAPVYTDGPRKLFAKQPITIVKK
jgi:hypothetical protein